RPLTCAAVDPDEALGELVEEEERRARRLRRILEELRRLGRGAGSEGQEGRYSLIAGSAIPERLSGLVSGASREVRGILDHWGLELAIASKREISAAALRDVDVRLVVDGLDEESARGRELAEFARASPHGGGWSAFMFDGRAALLLDSRAGVGILLESPTVVGALGALFDRMWREGMPLGTFLELVSAGLPGAASLVEGEAEVLGGILEAALSSFPLEGLAPLADAAYARFLKLMPEVDAEPLEAAMVVWGALVREGLPRASVRYDQLTKIVTIEYESPARMPPTPWFLAFLGYLRSRGMEPSVMHSSTERGMSIIQLKLPSRAPLI
ncbi:MAG: hypothetical protein ACP5ID_03845, partial [Conexivisphaera sp.]